MAWIVEADYFAASGDAAVATAALGDARHDGYPLARLATTAWPSAPLARALIGDAGPYR